jgi:hypothetical protein
MSIEDTLRNMIETNSTTKINGPVMKISVTSLKSLLHKLNTDEVDVLINSSEMVIKFVDEVYQHVQSKKIIYHSLFSLTRNSDYERALLSQIRKEKDI